MDLVKLIAVVEKRLDFHDGVLIAICMPSCCNSIVAVTLNPAFFLVALAQPLLSQSNLGTGHDSSLGQLITHSIGSFYGIERTPEMGHGQQIDDGYWVMDWVAVQNFPLVLLVIGLGIRV
ncbi:hypothetical protein BDD12DRAFT_850172 [Trichophaea hybrida]|nr:hypothetical protein BDD12DRAFT_850172 [Trichophaea hybrida]